MIARGPTPAPRPPDREPGEADPAPVPPARPVRYGAIECRRDGAGSVRRWREGGSLRQGLVLSALLALVLSPAACTSARKVKPKPPPTPNQVLYERARSLIDARRFERARESLTQIGTKEVQSPALDPLVKIALADSYFYQPGIANLIEAQSRYTQFLAFYPSNPRVGYAQFQVAMCYFKQSPQPHHDQTYTRKAMEEFEKVRKIDPNGHYVRASNLMRDRCLDKLADHDFQVGLFYFKRKAYDGVVSRFRELLDTYPRYERSDRIYYYLGLALVRSGEAAEGRIYLEKVQRDFPESRFARKARGNLD